MAKNLLLTAVLITAIYSTRTLAEDFADEVVSDALISDFEDAEAEAKIDIDNMSRNGFDADQLVDEFAHSKAIEDAIHGQDAVKSVPISTQERVRKRHGAAKKELLLAQAALRWRRFGQPTPGIFESDDDDEDGTRGHRVSDFEEVDPLGIDSLGFSSELHKQHLFLQPCRTPYSVMWDDGDEVVEAMQYAFNIVAANFSRQSNTTAGIPVWQLPRVLQLYLDARADGMHFDEWALAQKKLLDFAHENGIADAASVISSSTFASPRFVHLSSTLMHRLWAMREFRREIERKVKLNGLDNLLSAEHHYLHLRSGLIDDLLQQGSISDEQVEWLRHEDRRQRDDYSLVPHPSVSLDEARRGPLVRILEGTHENPGVSSAGGPPDPSDFATLQAYLSAKQEYYS